MPTYPPPNPRALLTVLADFYALQSAVPHGYPEAHGAVGNCVLHDVGYTLWKELFADVVDVLASRLDQDLSLICAAEVAHLANVDGNTKLAFYEMFGDAGEVWWHAGICRNAPTLCSQQFVAAVKLAQDSFLGGDPVSLEDGVDTVSYLYRWICQKAAEIYTGVSIFDVSQVAFTSEFAWKGAFGGKLWDTIAKTWRQLRDSVLPSRQIECIDRLVSLQHNTNTLFTKCQHYVPNWNLAGELLDAKFFAKSPYALLPRCSDVVRDFFSGYTSPIRRLCCWSKHTGDTNSPSGLVSVMVGGKATRMASTSLPSIDKLPLVRKLHSAVGESLATNSCGKTISSMYVTDDELMDIAEDQTDAHLVSCSAEVQSPKLSEIKLLAHTFMESLFVSVPTSGFSLGQVLESVEPIQITTSGVPISNLTIRKRLIGLTTEFRVAVTLAWVNFSDFKDVVLSVRCISGNSSSQALFATDPKLVAEIRYTDSHEFNELLDPIRAFIYGAYQAALTKSGKPAKVVLVDSNLVSWHTGDHISQVELLVDDVRACKKVMNRLEKRKNQHAVLVWPSETSVRAIIKQ